MRFFIESAIHSMNLVSFDIFRTLGLPDTTVLKPDDLFRQKDLLRQADWGMV